MAGVLEAGTLVSLISGVITIIDATRTVYDATKDAQGQPQAFRQVAARLPLVKDILQRAEEKTGVLHEWVMTIGPITIVSRSFGLHRPGCQYHEYNEGVAVERRCWVLAI
jgi:hypothetical protein